MHQPPKAHDPHAFPFCPRCGAYRHQGPCPAPAPLPPPPAPAMLRPLSAALAPAAPPLPAAPSAPPPASPVDFPPGALAAPLRRGGAPPAPRPIRAPHLRRGAGVAIAALLVFCAMAALAYFMNAS